MKKERLVLVVCALSINLHLFGQFATGALWSEEKAATVELVKLDTFLVKRLAKSLSPNPASYYLSTPTVGNQGKQGSCSGWAVGYAATSILAYDKYGQDWTLATMSPSYIYNQAKATDDCSVGAYLVDALNIAKEHGNCRLREMPYTDASCSQMPTAAQHQAASYNTLSYVRINSTSISDMCTAIANQYPIVVGLFTTSSFRSMWYSDGIWRVNERSNNDGYHFCCIVGYDNANRMFKVQNSWGSINGDNGFFWVTYDLVSDGAFNEAYVLYNLNPSIDIFIQGPSRFCDTASYTLTNVPAGATITWKDYNRINPTYPYYIKSGQGTSRVLYQRGRQDDGRVHRLDFVSSDYTGSAVVSAVVSLNGHSYTVSKNVYIGAVAPQVVLYDAQGIRQVVPHVGASYRMEVNNCRDVADNQFHWVVSSSVQEFERLGLGRYFPLIIDERQTITAQVSYDTDECGTVTTTKTFLFTLLMQPLSASLVFRNPAGVGEDLDVGIALSGENTSSTTYSLQSNTETGVYTLELWSEQYGRVRTVEADTPTTQMSLSGLNAGTYFLKLIINNETVATQQLIIK